MKYAIPQTVFMFDGSTTTTDSHVDTFAKFHGDYPNFELDLDVTYNPEVDIVLGMDWMQKAKLAIDFGHGCIEFPTLPIEVHAKKVRRAKADRPLWRYKSVPSTLSNAAHVGTHTSCPP